MKINIIPIVSALHDGVAINEETKALISKIEDLSEYSFNISDIAHLYETELSLVLVQSGGSEGRFLDMEKNLKPPYYLLTYGSNNSLAASMEILSYLKNKNEKAEILHGPAEYIISRLNELHDKKEKTPVRLGVVGKPSDWLIASDVDYDKCSNDFAFDNQIIAQILSGELQSETTLPSIRTMAKELRVSVITIKKAWEELEKGGYIRTIAGKGSYVSTLTDKALDKKKLNLLKDLFRQDIAHCKTLEISKEEIIQIIDELYENKS